MLSALSMSEKSGSVKNIFFCNKTLLVIVRSGSYTYGKFINRRQSNSSPFNTAPDAET